MSSALKTDREQGWRGVDDKEGWRNIQGCLEQGCLEQGCAEVAEAGSGAVRQQSAALLVQFQMQHQ